MFVLLFLFILVPIVEIYVIIQVGQAIGPLWTVALLIIDSIVGWMLMRSQSRAAWRRFNDTLAAGRVPHREVIDGALIIFGGALLLTPGFTTDILGLFLLLPPTRAVVRALIVRRFGGGIMVSAASSVGSRAWRSRQSRGGPAAPTGPTGTYDVEGTASEVDPPRLP